MPNIEGEWIMYGVDEDDPCRIHTVEELMEYIEEVGFLPLFKNDIPGFSVEERTVAHHWWCENPEYDPWIWREIVARKGEIAYGKFFDKKAGFISKKWFPIFANYRRDGYDFDSRWEDEKASMRQKKIMDLFEDEDTELYSFEVKKLAGFGKNGEKNFDGTITGLQMQTYLCVRGFRQRKNKAGESYGWPMAIYSRPERLWGYEHLSSAYKEEPLELGKRIIEYMKEIYPIASEQQINKVILG